MRRAILLTLFISLAIICGCGQAEPAGTAEQRDLGEAVLEPGRQFRLSPGVIVNTTETSVEARASTPLPSFSLSSGPAGSEEVAMTLQNLHRRAQIRVESVSALDSTQAFGCPEEQSEEGVVCRGRDAQPGSPLCDPPDLERSEQTPTRINLEVSQQPCRRTNYSVYLDETSAAEPLRLAVLGRTASLDQLREALLAATSDEPDAVVLLGDNTENTSLNGLRQLDAALTRSDYPAIVLPGEAEIVEGSREQFLSTFGAFDLTSDLKGASLTTFFSAGGELGEDGVSRLQSKLRRLDDTRPRLLFTHTPPIDPIGPRDAGLESQIEGARVMSALADRGVEDLFVGHINDATTQDVNEVRVHLTSVEEAGEYLWVSVSGDQVSVDRRDID